MNSLISVLLLLSCFSSNAAERQSWADDGMDVCRTDSSVVTSVAEIPALVASAVRGQRVEEAIALINEFPNSKGLLKAVCNSYSVEQVYQLLAYLKKQGYVPAKNEISEAFDALLNLTLDSSMTEEFLELWGDHLDFTSIGEIVLACVRFDQPIPSYLVDVMNSAKPTFELTKQLAQIMDIIVSMYHETSFLQKLSPFFGIPQDGNNGKLCYMRAKSRLTRIKLELEDRTMKLQKINACNITDADLQSYLSSGNGCIEDLLEIAVKSDNHHIFHAKKEAQPTEDAPLEPINTLNSVAFLLSEGADPFALDSLTGEPLSALPNLSPDIRNTLVSAQAAYVFPKMKELMLLGELNMDVVGELSQKLIQVEFDERKAKLLPIVRQY